MKRPTTQHGGNPNGLSAPDAWQSVGLVLFIKILAFPADIGRKPASPARGSRRERVRRRCANTPANETADLVPLNKAAPVRTVSYMLDNPKALNRSGVYPSSYCCTVVAYNSCNGHLRFLRFALKMTRFDYLPETPEWTDWKQIRHEWLRHPPKWSSKIWFRKIF